MTDTNTQTNSDQRWQEKLDGCRCPLCGNNSVQFQDPKGALTDAKIVCHSCDSRFDSVFGVPYLGGFSSDDFLSLIEIVAGLAARARFVDGSWQLANEGDQEGAVDTIFGQFQNPSLLYGESPTGTPIQSPRIAMHHAAIQAWGPITFAHKKVLDIGAGTGFDSMYYHREGAYVTALEFSPILAGVGRQSCPDLRWIGGKGEHLPFADEYFDLVVANAAMHHLGDPVTALSEMIRVLKPGGDLVTVSDTFCPDTYSETDEARVFDGHPDVMSGVNEQLIRIGPFLRELEKRKNKLDVSVLTGTIDGLSTTAKSWTLEQALDTLPSYTGAFSMRVKKNGPTSHTFAPIQIDMRPSEVLKQSQTKSSALSKMATLAPSKFHNASVLSADNPKVRQLMGWALPDHLPNSRGAYSEASLLVDQAYLGQRLHFSVLLPWVAGPHDSHLAVLWNSREIASFPLRRGLWHAFEVETPEPSSDTLKTHLLTWQIIDTNNSIPAKRFRISELGVGTGISNAPNGLEDFGVETLFETGIAGPSPSLIASGDFSLDTEIFMRLRQWHETLAFHVKDEQRAIYEWQPASDACARVSNMNEQETDGSSLIVLCARNEPSALNLAEENNLSISDRRIYAAFPGGFSKQLSQCRRENLLQAAKRRLAANLSPEMTNKLRAFARRTGIAARI